MNNLKKTYPAYDDWLSENMAGLIKAVAHLPKKETADIVEIAGRLIWLAAQQQEGYVMVPLEPTQDMLDAQDYIRDVSAIEIYKAMIQAAQE